MSKRKYLEIVLGVSIFISPTAYSAGIGDIALCPPGASAIAAQIPMLDVGQFSQSEISAKLASESDLALTGMKHSEDVRNLSIMTDYTSQSMPVIRISGCGHVADVKKLNFLLDFRWPQGRVLREYSIDVRNSMVASSQMIDGISVLEQTILSYPPTSEFIMSSNSTKLALTSTAPAASNAETFIDAERSLEAGSFYLVRPGETIWGIASRLISDKTVNERIDATIALNPHSFFNMNPDRLKANTILKLP
jgi:pilus assembly protein FimV